MQGDVILSCRIRIKRDTLANNECNGLDLGLVLRRPSESLILRDGAMQTRSARVGPSAGW